MEDLINNVILLDGLKNPDKNQFAEIPDKNVILVKLTQNQYMIIDSDDK